MCVVCVRDPSEASITGGYEQPDVAAENWSLVLWKISTPSFMLSHIFGPVMAIFKPLVNIPDLSCNVARIFLGKGPVWCWLSGLGQSSKSLQNDRLVKMFKGPALSIRKCRDNWSTPETPNFLLCPSNHVYSNVFEAKVDASVSTWYFSVCPEILSPKLCFENNIF